MRHSRIDKKIATYIETPSEETNYEQLDRERTYSKSHGNHLNNNADNHINTGLKKNKFKQSIAKESDAFSGHSVLNILHFGFGKMGVHLN